MSSMLSPLRKFWPDVSIWPLRILIFSLSTLSAIGLLMVAFAAPGRAQEERKRKVPGLDKITAGADHQAFSGTVQSLDLRHSILNVNTVQGGDTEIFPVKKSVHVESANGGKLRVDELQPGTSVIIYFEQRGEHRTVRDIVVLESARAKNKAKKPSPS
jgi:hypothetical protein